MFHSSVDIGNNFRKTFNSNNLNFDDERESIRSRQIYSPAFTKRFETFQDEFNEIGVTEEEKFEIVENVKISLEKISPENRMSHFDIALNKSILKLKKKKSESKYALVLIIICIKYLHNFLFIRIWK